MQPLAQPPETKEPSLTRWLFLLWRRINATAGMAWSIVDKTGSNLTDIETRNHADLQNINTATYTHLSSTNHTDLTDGGESTLHYHASDRDSANFTGTNWTDLTDSGVTTLHKHETTGVNYPASLAIGVPTHINSIQDLLDHSWSAGITDGCALTDNGDGTVGIALGNATLRSSADPHSALYNVKVNAQSPITLTDDSTNYIYLDYNAGTPTFVANTSVSSFNGMNKIIAWLVHREGTLLHSLDARSTNVDFSRKAAHRNLDTSRFTFTPAGTALGSPSGLTISVTSGKFYFMLEELPHDAFDTSIAGTANANVFTLWNHVAGVYTSTADQKSVGTTLYDDGTGTATLGNNKFGVTWFYIINDAPSELHAVMGQAEYANSADAEVATPPSSLPTLLSGFGSLIGFVTYEKSAVAFTDIKSAFATQFGSSAAPSHEGLAGLLGGAVNDHQHLTTNELNSVKADLWAFAAAHG